MQSESEKIILEKLNTVLQELETLKSGRPAPTRIPLKDFCQERNITRPTAYAWDQRGLIKMERVGGRQFVNLSSITVTKKFERKP
jgi:hypothetical protein